MKSSYLHKRNEGCSYWEWSGLTDEEQFFRQLERAPAGGVTVGHSVTLIHIAHMMVIIHHNLRLYGFSSLIAEITFRWGTMNISNMHASLLSRHSIAIKSAPVFTRMSPLFSFVVFGLVARLACSAWQCHNSKPIYLPSHQIIQGKKINCPCIMCGHVLSSMSVLSLSHGLLSRAVLCAVCPFSGILSCHTCIQSSHKVWKFSCRNACVSLVCTPFEGNNKFVNSQIFRRVVKFGKYASQNFKQVSCLLQSQNFHLSYQVRSCCHQNVSNEGCEVIGPGDYHCQQSVQIFHWPVVTTASCFISSFYANTHTDYQMLNWT